MAKKESPNPNKIDVHHHFVPECYAKGKMETIQLPRSLLICEQHSARPAEILQVGVFLHGVSKAVRI